MKNQTICINCNSENVIRFGKTPIGNNRFRCKTCLKTWTEKQNNAVKATMPELAEMYLNGSSYRDLVKLCQTSPMRINIKMRNYFNSFIHWENFIDNFSNVKSSGIIVLASRKFRSSFSKIDNTMNLLVAVDAISMNIIGYELVQIEDSESWGILLGRLKDRGYYPNTFFSINSQIIKKTISDYFPDAQLKFNFHRNIREKEISCCLSKMQLNKKIIFDSVKNYSQSTNKNLTKYFNFKDDKELTDWLLSKQNLFFSRIRLRNDSFPKHRIEHLLTNFQKRFEKFHLIKDDPSPIVNLWITREMLKKIDNFSQFSYFIQQPIDYNFQNYLKNINARNLNINKEQPLGTKFIIEILARCVELPLISSECKLEIVDCCII